MPNVLGTLSSALILQRALELVFTKRPILNRISLDLQPEAVKWNQEVQSRIFSIPPVNDFGTGAQDRADTDVPVTIDKFKEVHHKFTIQELSSTDRNLVDESAEPLAVAIGNHMVDAIAALWVVANFANETTQATAGVNYATLVALRKALTGRGAPDDRFVAANADVYEKWLNDATIIAWLNNQNNGGAIMTGVLPNVAGFNGIFEYPALPGTGNMTAFAGSKDTTVMATRVPKDPRELLPNAPFPGNMAVVSVANGFSVMATEWIDPSTLDANVRMIWMYGVAKGNGNNGQILKSAE